MMYIDILNKVMKIIDDNSNEGFIDIAILKDKLLDLDETLTERITILKNKEINEIDERLRIAKLEKAKLEKQKPINEYGET